jgi:hypothetical protein
MSDRAIELFLEAYKTKMTPEYQRTVLDQVVDIYLEGQGAGIVFCSIGMDPMEALKATIKESLEKHPPGTQFGFFLDAIAVYSKASIEIMERLNSQDPDLLAVIGKMRQVHTLSEETDKIMANSSHADKVKESIADIIQKIRELQFD